MGNQCIDEKTGALLRYSRYSIRNFPFEKRKIYELHLANCLFCREQSKKYKMGKARLSFAFMLTGFGFIYVAPQLPFRMVSVACFIVGAAWIVSGLIKLCGK